MNASRYPLLYQANTRVWLTRLGRQLGRPATLDDLPGLRARRPCRVRFRLDLDAGCLDDRSRRSRHLALQSGMAPGVRTDPAGPDGRRHWWILFCHHRLHRRRRPRRRAGPSAAPEAARRARTPADARFRSQPHGTGPSLGHGPSRPLHFGNRRGSFAVPSELLPGG